jgi:hypothetical protein
MADKQEAVTCAKFNKISIKQMMLSRNMQDGVVNLQYEDFPLWQLVEQ